MLLRHDIFGSADFFVPNIDGLGSFFMGTKDSLDRESKVTEEH